MSIETEGAALQNPGVPGDLPFDTFIYGSPPLPYPAVLNQYAIYNAPAPGYTTGRIDISAFANLGGATPWPFANTNVPLNVTVTDDLAVASVSVFYAINGGPFTSSSCPLDTGSSYACTIPGNGNGTAVSYYVTATDTATNETDVPDASAPDMYTVGAANVPAGQYSTLSAGAGST